MVGSVFEVDLDRWYVYIIVVGETPVYVGKGTGGRMWESAYNSYLNMNRTYKPHKVEPHFLFTGIANEHVAYGLESYTIYSYDEAGCELHNKQRRTIQRQETWSVKDFTGPGDIIRYHPPPCLIPDRLAIELALGNFKEPIDLQFQQYLLFKYYQLGKYGISVVLK